MLYIVLIPLISELNPGPPVCYTIDKSVHLIGDSMLSSVKDKKLSAMFCGRVHSTSLRGADVGRITQSVMQLRKHK